MIDKKVQKLCADFVVEWSKYLAVNPSLTLDYSWPSLGVLDLMTYSCRYQESLPTQLDLMLKGVAAYLAIMADSCLSSSVDKLEVVDTSEGISITLTGGECIPEGEATTLPVEKMLRICLKEFTNPFSVTRNFKTNISFESQVLPLFGIGLFTGLARGVEGWWLNKDPVYLKPVIDNVCRVLATQSADAYARVFPNEPLGQLAELYLNKLIYPPMMMNENLPLLGAIPAILEYFKDYKISADAALKLGENLVLSPDPLFSNLGLVLCAALSEKIPGPMVLSAAQRKGSSMAFLRRAMKEIRGFYGMKRDWIEVGLTSPEMYVQLAVEKAMKIHPWLYLSKNRIKADIDDNILTPLIIKICEYDIEGAIELADKILEVRPEDVEIAMQRVKLELMKGEQCNQDKVNDLLKELMSSSRADSLPEYYYLLGSISLGKKDAAKALNYFKAALAINVTDISLLADIQNNAAWSCMLLNKLGQALIYIEQALTNSNCPVTILLNKASVLADLGDFIGSLAIRKKLFLLSPFDRRVFASLTIEDVLKKGAAH